MATLPLPSPRLIARSGAPTTSASGTTSSGSPPPESWTKSIKATSSSYNSNNTLLGPGKWINNNNKSGGGSSSADGLSSARQQHHHQHQRHHYNSSNYRQNSVSVEDDLAARRGQLFPAKLALALGMINTLLGVLLVAFGALALWEQASMAYLGSGLWTGSVVILSGLMGIMAGLKRTNLVYIVSYLLMNVLALAAIGLLLIFAAAGLARDSDAPHAYFIDQEEGERVEILGTVPIRQRPVIINAVLVALGTLSTVCSLAATVICLREACLCYSSSSVLRHHRRLVNSQSSSCCNSTTHLQQHLVNGRPATGATTAANLLAADQSPEGQARAYRLMRWLRQSHHHQQQQQQQQRHRQLQAMAAAAAAASGAYYPPVPVHPVGTAYVIPVAAAGGGPVAPPPPPTAFYQFHPAVMVPAAAHGHHSHHHLTHMIPYGVQHPQQQMQTDTKKKSKKKKKNSSNLHIPNDDPSIAAASLSDHNQIETASVDGRGHLSKAERHVNSSSSITNNVINDGASVVSSFVCNGLDRDIAEEFILHSLTVDQVPSEANSLIIMSAPKQQ